MQNPHKSEQNNYKNEKRNESWNEKIGEMSIFHDTYKKWI